MNIKNKFIYRLAAAGLACSLFLAPLSVRAAETAEDLNQTVLSKPVDSNSWENWPDGPSISAESGIVMEADTGLVLYDKAMTEKQYPASITKILTALVALEHCDPSEEITYSYYATHSIEFGSSSIARTEGEVLTLEESLYGLMLASANECANAIAEHVAGSIDAFTVLMNEKAKELGCVNSNFTNANGLHDENHYTCAYDMALITRAAIQNEDFRRIAGSATYTLRATNKNDKELNLQNHHYMIYPYRTSKYVDDTVFAGKTGYTTDSLYTLVTCARRNDMDVIVVTMRTNATGSKGEPLYPDTAALLDYANNFHKINIAENEQTFVVGNAYDFSMESEELKASASLISIDKNSFVILPNTVSFTNADPSIVLEKEGGEEKAFLKYEFAGQTVGKAPITLKSPKEDAAFSGKDQEKEKGESTKFITINLKIIFIVLLVLLLIAGISLLIWNFYQRNRSRIRKAVNIYRKKQFLRRRNHRRSRRRR